MDTATEKIQLQLFDMRETYFPKLSDLTSDAPKVQESRQFPKYCPVVSVALASALLPGKGESVTVGTKDSNDIAIIANHIEDGFIFVVQAVGKEIMGIKRGVLRSGFALNVLLDVKFKRPDAVVVRKKEKSWDYCHYFYESKKHELDEYRKMLEGKQVDGC